MNNNVYLKQTDKFSQMLFRVLIVLIWTQNTVLGFVSVVIARLPIVGFIAPFFIPTIILLSLVLSYRHLLKYIKSIDIVIYLCVIAVTLGSIVFCKTSSSYVAAIAFDFLILTFPMYFIGLSFNLEESKTDLFWASLVSLLATMAYQFYYIYSGRSFDGNSSMHTAYWLLPSVLYLAAYAMNHKQKIYFLLAVISSVCMLLFGSRGPILILVVFWALCIFKELVSIKSKGVKFLYIGLISICVFLVFYKDNFIKILEFMSEFVGNLGFHTRIFDVLIKGNAMDDSGRGALQDIIIGKISENPLFGYGMMSDRIFINELQNFSGINLFAYVHNLFLEIWCHWGVILGTLILLVVISIPVRSLYICKNKEKFYFILMLICYVFIKLFISGSYLYEANLYLLLGISVSRESRRR